MLSASDARAAVISKDWSATLAHCRAGLQSDGTSYPLRCLEALCCLHLGWHEQAAQACCTAVALQSDSPHAWKLQLRLRVARQDLVHDTAVHVWLILMSHADGTSAAEFLQRTSAMGLSLHLGVTVESLEAPTVSMQLLPVPSTLNTGGQGEPGLSGLAK